ncbi:ATP-binding protein [Lactobacillus sp. UCMA15818]|uniref:ATP-binding protein n=1 Tax=Lactobacillus sp. UCMA15818 TaxID=2583394 RepID=UPI0025B1F987|nr:ATP-binding protein [Lactobacillus sp. UCMA15818]MDN2452542.1 AAA family ATPase [Lactobacillus sp. UCMA15818]
MKQEEKNLFYYLSQNDLERSKLSALKLLATKKSQRDQKLVDYYTDKIGYSEKAPDIPEEVKDIILPVDVSDKSFSASRVYITKDNAKEIESVKARIKLKDKLEALHFNSKNTLLIHGKSGLGKTLLIKYMAHKLKMPLYYVDFSQLIDSALGGTAKNVSKVFRFFDQSNGILLLDEVDAIALKRDNSPQEVGDMNRVTISLMQYLDKLHSNGILVAITNRYEALDPAFKRRFAQHYEMKPLDYQEKQQMALLFLNDVGIEKSYQWIADFVIQHDNENNSELIDSLEKIVIEKLVKESLGVEV